MIPKIGSLYNNVAVDQFLIYLLELGDPDETLRKLGVSRTHLRSLEGDDEISAAMDTRREAVIATAWRLEPGTGRAVKWLWAELEPYIETIIRGSMSALCYGYAVQEVIYKRGQFIGIDSVEEKPFEWFSFAPDGTLLLRNKDGDLIPTDETYPGKFILSRRLPSYRNPYGEAMYSRLYWPWFFRKSGWQFWCQMLERCGAPFLKGTAPRGEMIDSSGVVKDNVAILGAALQSAVQNATLALPEGWTAEFMSAAQTGASFQDFETACVKRIQRLILGQTLTSDTGADGGGSYALGQVHNEVRIDRRNADIRLVSQAIQTLIDNLWSLNGFTGTPPDFIMEDGQGLELPRAERDAKLVQAGIIKLTPEYLLRVYDFEDGDFLIPEAQPTQILRQDSQQQEDPEELEDDSEDDEPMNATNLSLLKFAPTKSFPDQESLDTGIDALIAARNNHAIAADMVQPVIDLVMRSKDYREVLAGLAETFPDMDSDRLEERMARAMFAADIWGMVNSQKD